jgi:DNA-binding response OmpR family regulator
MPIIFVSGTRMETYDRVAGLLLGGDDYVIKPFEPEELIARVRRAITRTAQSEPFRRRSFASPPARRRSSGCSPTGSETQAISDRLQISAKTVSSHTQRLLPKLRVHSRTEAVALAYRVGAYWKRPPTRP